MKIISVLIILSCLLEKINSFHHIKSITNENIQRKAVEELIKRILPDRFSEFEVIIKSNTSIDDRDYFHIENQDGIVRISSSTGVAAATGFNYYLKYHCNCQISWQTSQLDLPEILPKINTTIRLNDKFRYYQNVCTTSYSFVWWQWPQWQNHIDWIVLNGFNLVLTFHGQEMIWQRVYHKFNLTQNEIDTHFSGPAFLAWLRMGNIRGWAGPLSKSWQYRSMILQKQIVQRLRDFGVITVLPAFAGHVPRPFKQLYPNTRMVKMGTWNRFDDQYCCPYFLDPTEGLFNEIGRSFMEEQIKEFGTDHVYNCDSFNENTPTSSNLTYLKNVGASIFKAMTDIDRDAVWIMQNWLFVHDFLFWTTDRAKSLLTSVPKGKMIVLDLQSEQFPQYNRFEQYFGQPYIWCMLHNFGGTLGLFGSSSIINREPIVARNLPNSTMIGTGLTMEGINQNYVIYDLMIENTWQQQSTNLTEWFDHYTQRRYNYADQNAMLAWRILQKTIYDYKGLNKMRGQYAITRTPSLKINTWCWYSRTDLLSAWNHLIQASDNLRNNTGYLYDLVDVTRQVLQKTGDDLYEDLLEAYTNKNVNEFNEKSMKFLEIFDDLEWILASNRDFLLGRWLEAAKSCAETPHDQVLFEYNARNQITLWGPRGEIMNYANKQWSGIVSYFFGKRWSLFISYMNETLLNGNGFNQTYIKAKMFKDVEEPFTFDRTKFPTQPTGDSIEIAKQIQQKWIETHQRLPRRSNRKLHNFSTIPHILLVEN